MKFRLRSVETKNTIKIQISTPNCSLHDLQIVVAEQLSIAPQSLHLSLNSKDELISPPEETLESLRLASGDLIFYTLNPDGFCSKTQNQNSQQQIAQVKPDPHPQFQVREPNSEEPEFSAQIDDENLLEFESMDVDEPVVCKSCSIPCFLKKVLLEEVVESKGGHGLLIIAVHAVMLESGFVGFDPETQKKIKGFRLPEGWLSSSLLTLRYTIPELVIPDLVQGIAVLKFQILGKFVIVYGSSGKGSDIHRLSLDVSRIVPSIDYTTRNCNLLSGVDESSETHHNLGSSSKLVHEREVFELWKIVKDGLSMPMLTILCEKNGLTPPPSLMRLPTELKIKIFEFLPGVDLAKVGCVCGELKYLSLNDDLWKQRFFEEFGLLDVKPDSLNWKDKYVICWRRKKKPVPMTTRRRAFPFMLPQFPARRPTPYGPPIFPYIGGDFDRFPALGAGIPFGNRGNVPGFRLRQSFAPRCDLSGLDN